MAREGWTLTVRAGSDVQRERFARLDGALDSLDAHVRRLAPTARREEASLLVRRIEPAAQVVARLELSGHEAERGRTHAGVDLRGDGSTEAFTGRIRKQPIERREGESALDALRRELATKS
jgi:hypothetical protein